MKRRLLNLLIALDQLAWVVLTLGNGLPDETLSAAAWRMEAQGKLAGRILRPVIDFLFRPIEADHCWESYARECSRSQLPSVYQPQTEKK